MLETKRLILKLTNISDLDYLSALRSDPEVMRYTTTGVQTRDQVKEWMSYSDAYFEKHGLAFFSVFEKETGEFAGQAGLFHLGFDDRQPEIELAYRLHTKFWYRGYATELAKMLIQWGFKKHGFSKIIAMVFPENERSRRVMEKIGMFYCGMIDFRGCPLPRYEIINNLMDLNEIKLIPASIDEDYPIIQNLASYYAYDLSEYMGWAQEKDGTQSALNLSGYWQEENAFPFIIKYQDELVGFVIVDMKVSDLANNFNMTHFFILRKFTRKGFGRHVAFQYFKQFRGKWEVFVMPGNEGAYRFWRNLIKDYTGNQFKEYTRTVGQSRRNIFEFSSNAEREK